MKDQRLRLTNLEDFDHYVLDPHKAPDEVLHHVHELAQRARVRAGVLAGLLKGSTPDQVKPDLLSMDLEAMSADLGRAAFWSEMLFSELNRERVLKCAGSYDLPE